MKKHTMSNFSVVSNNQANQLSIIRKNTEGKKNVKYVYTEKDLGEGLLEAGVSPGYIVGKQLQYISNF